MPTLIDAIGGPAGLTMFGACVCFLGGIGSLLAKQRSRRWLSINAGVTVVLGAFISAVGAFLASAESARFERELRHKSEEIVAMITGGDSFCYLRLHPESTHLIGTILHQGRYPLYDLAIRLVDQKPFASPLPTGTNPFRTGLILERDLKTLGTDQAMPIGGAFEIKGPGPERFLAQFSARNGNFVQMIRVLRVGDKWLQATKVERWIPNASPTVIFEKIDPGFPDDEIDWKAEPEVR